LCYFNSFEVDHSDRWALDLRVEPRMSADERQTRRAAWNVAVQRVLRSRQ
jgi:hypothetical protein